MNHADIKARYFPAPELDENGNEDMTCDQCAAIMINGVYCHETGCPNSRKIKIDGRWTTPEQEDEE